MQQLLTRALQKVTNCALGNPILKMGVHTTKGELLVALFTRLFECIVRKLSIVAVVVENFYAMFGGKLLEGVFGFERLLS